MQELLSTRRLCSNLSGIRSSLALLTALRGRLLICCCARPQLAGDRMRLDQLKRREFITLIGGAAAPWPLMAQAQQPERVRRIGVVILYPENDPQGQLRAAAFRGELDKAG